MTRKISLALAVAGAGVLSGNADAASTTFGGVATLRGGYGNNPNLNSVDSTSSAIVGGSLSAILSRATGAGRTTLTGVADVSQGFNGNGRSENYTAQLNQSQQFTSRLQGSADVIYQDSTNPGPNYSTDARDLIPIGDILTLGTHSRQVSGDANLGYQFTAKDLFQGGVNVTHTTYQGATASGYTQYLGSAGYLRTISSSTRIGLQASYTRVSSDLYPGSSSSSLGVQLTQRINQRWTFAGGINGLLQRTNGSTFKTIGFNGSLCGDYARYTICVLTSRQSAASGIGGLRVDTQAGARLNYKLSARSSVDVTTTYDISTAEGIDLSKQHYVDGAVSYRRTITQRVSGGFSVRYQRRTTDAIGTIFGGQSKSYSATANISYQFGRIS